MSCRDVDVRPGDLVLRSPCNWTYVLFFACLSTLHYINAFTAFAHSRWEGYLSLIFGCVFLTGSLVCWRSHFEMSILLAQKRIRLRNGCGKIHFERSISFKDVHGVRVTLSRAPDYPISRIEVLCDNEDIECPPTSIPRQEALCLAVLMGVPLIKVSDEEAPAEEEIRQVQPTSRV